MFTPWPPQQITAESGAEASYQEWLARNQAAVDWLGESAYRRCMKFAEGPPRHRDLILTRASDPRTFAAAANLLKAASLFVT